MKEIRCIIVEDQPEQQEALKKMILPFSQLKLIEVFNNTPKLSYIEEEKIDLVFLDNHLRGSKDGEGLIEFLDGREYPKIVFISGETIDWGNVNYRTNVLHVIDKKHLNNETFEKVITKILIHFNIKPDLFPNTTVVEVSKRNEDSSISFKRQKAMDIIYIEAFNNRVYNGMHIANHILIHTTEGDYLVRDTILNFYNELPENLKTLPKELLERNQGGWFERISQSYIVNRKFITEYNRNNNEIGLENVKERLGVTNICRVPIRDLILSM